MNNVHPRLQVTLENCADEPIHIPGLIQPHGAMLVFNGTLNLVGWSQNVTETLQIAGRVGVGLGDLAITKGLETLVVGVRDEIVNGNAAPSYLETQIGEVTFDCIAHAYKNLIIVEFERRELPADLVATFALKAHSAISRLRREGTIQSLLERAVEYVRDITNFDRVMAYRFRHDDSGDVVAESRAEGLHPYLGQRYPASDIPAQARRLYIANTLRLIANVNYDPIPMVGQADAEPIDMSHCTLRSVSPVHIEYLKNMGVGASMSISIVIKNRLWGLIACHHRGDYIVPYSIRMAIDVLAQVLASTAAQLVTTENAQRVDNAALLRAEVAETMLHAVDLIDGLASHAPQLCEVLNASALLLSYEGHIEVYGAVSTDVARAILGSIQEGSGEIIERNNRMDWPEALQTLIGSWTGMLALSFDPVAHGWVIALREEQSESVVWAGKDAKADKTGPLGIRLTPRGSFDEWRETVQGQAVPWDEAELTIAERMMSAMRRSTAIRHAEVERARAELLAMLGHDLRTPLQSISMVASLMEQKKEHETLGKRIRSSSNRMSRLISQVLDMSRVNGGMSFGLDKQPIDLSILIFDLIDEARHAHPKVRYETDLIESVIVPVDADRIAQVIGNLISNARHHGDIDHPIRVSLSKRSDNAVIEVANAGAAIRADALANLFNPFKHTSANSRQNRRGLGLGLYIVKQIVEGHGGTIAYSYAEPNVIFTVTLNPK